MNPGIILISRSLYARIYGDREGEKDLADVTIAVGINILYKKPW